MIDGPCREMTCDEILTAWAETRAALKAERPIVANLLARVNELDAALREEQQENGNLAGWLGAVWGVLTCAFDEKDCEPDECQKHGVAKLLAERKARRGK